MAEEPWDWLLMTDAEELHARSRARMELTERLIEQSREVLESSRALLDRTRPIRPSDLLAAWPARAGTVLLVDDDDLARHAVSAIIEGSGHRVIATRSADEALGIIARQHVDVLFTDIVMPERDGIELAKQAKKQCPDIKLMFITGYDARASDAIPMRPLLFKPLHAHQIEAALGDLARGGVDEV
jgi:two-component system, cell cycle response regulator CpdR